MINSLDKIEEEVIGLLQDLDESLTYHSIAHTRYVVEVSMKIADYYKLDEHDKGLLKIAALFHDSGFLLARENHEEASCKLAEKHLKDHNLSDSDLECIKGMIMATKVPQRATSLLQEIIADADLEYLGTKHFWKVGNLLYKELVNVHPDMTREQWNRLQLNFLLNHSYHTSYCQRYKEKRRQKHIAELKELLS